MAKQIFLSLSLTLAASCISIISMQNSLKYLAIIFLSFHFVTWHYIENIYTFFYFNFPFELCTPKSIDQARFFVFL